MANTHQPRLPLWHAFRGQHITADDYRAILTATGSPRVCVSLIAGRCGSTLLASLVGQWGCCGMGNEVFNERPATVWQGRGATAREFLTTAIRHQQAGGVFWFQIAPHRYDHLVSGLDPTIPATWRHSAILRRDVVAQAVSYVYAIGSGIWHSFTAGHDPRTPVRLAEDVDVLADRVLLWIERIVAMEARIREVLTAHAAAPLILFYEDIVRAPLTAVDRLCRDCDVERPVPAPPFQPIVSRLAKAGTTAVLERLHARHGAAVQRFAEDRSAGILAWADALAPRADAGQPAPAGA